MKKIYPQNIVVGNILSIGGDIWKCEELGGGEISLWNYSTNYLFRSKIGNITNDVYLLDELETMQFLLEL